MDDPVRLGPPVVSINVPTCEVQRALRAVIPHASRERDAPDPYQRVHWRYDAGTGHLYVGATNGFTVGLAAVSVTHDWIGVDESRRWSTSVTTATHVRRSFPTRDEGSEEGFTDFLRFDVHAEYLVGTDVSGLLAGEQHRWLQSSEGIDEAHLLRVVRSVLASVAAGTEMLFTAPEFTIVSGRNLALFEDATVAYGQPLVLRPAMRDHAHVLFVACGDSFLGMVRQSVVREEYGAQLREWERGWLARLDVDTSVPIEPAGGVLAGPR